MRKRYLLKPNVKTKSFKLTDFTDITDFCENVYLDKEIRSANMQLKFSSTCGVMMQRMYIVRGRKYFVGSDGFLYELNGNQPTQKFKCGNVKGAMESIILQGENKTLYIDNEVAKVVEDVEYNVGLPCGKHFAIHQLRCFSADEYTVYFGSEFDLESRSMMLDNRGNINFTYDEGKVIGLFDFTSYLLIVCEKSFHKLTIVEGEFKIERIKTNFYAIDRSSFAKIREKLLFISDRKLYSFENFEIKQLPSIFIKDVLEVGTDVTFNGNYYYCQINDASKKCVLVYDLINNKETLLYVGNSVLVCKNLLFNYDEQCLYAISSNSTEGACKWISKKLDLGNMSKKSLLEVSIKLSKDAMLTISGDFGSKSFNLKAGLNKKGMNLSSKEYELEINCPSGDLIASDLQLKYIA